MQRRHLWVSAAAIVVLGFLLSQDVLARLAWQKYRRPDVALAIVRRDADLAMLLGNYFFGGQGFASPQRNFPYDLGRAERAYQKALAAKPGILWGHYQLARIYFVKGDYDRAIEEIGKELEANPENLRSLYIRGLIYGYRFYPGDLEKAEEDFLRFTQWAPKEWAGYNDLAWILSRIGKHREAKEVMQKAFVEIRDAEQNTWLWNSLGVALLNLGEYSPAQASLEQAQELAQDLAVGDWQRSYPGNNPADAEAGLQAFRNAIEENLRVSRAASVDK